MRKIYLQLSFSPGWAVLLCTVLLSCWDQIDERCIYYMEKYSKAISFCFDVVDWYEGDKTTTTTTTSISLRWIVFMVFLSRSIWRAKINIDRFAWIRKVCTQTLPLSNMFLLRFGPWLRIVAKGNKTCSTTENICVQRYIIQCQNIRMSGPNMETN